MRRQLKKSLLNGLIRFIVSIVHVLYSTMSTSSASSSSHHRSSVAIGDEDTDTTIKQHSSTALQAASNANNNNNDHYQLVLPVVDQSRRSSRSQLDNDNFFLNKDDTTTTETETESADTQQEDNDHDDDDDNADFYYTTPLSASSYTQYGVNKSSPYLSVQHHQRERVGLRRLSNLQMEKRHTRLRVIVLFAASVVLFIGLNNLAMMFWLCSNSSSSSSSSSSKSNNNSLDSTTTYTSATGGAGAGAGGYLLVTFYYYYRSIVSFRWTSDILHTNTTRRRNDSTPNIGLLLPHATASTKATPPVRMSNSSSSSSRKQMSGSVQTGSNQSELIAVPVVIDLEDLRVLNLTLSDEEAARVHVLNESFFDNDEGDEDLLKRNGSRPQRRQRACVHPRLDPFDAHMMQFVKPEKHLECNPKQNWIYVESGRLRVSKLAVKNHGLIVCAYIPLYRGPNDFTVYEGARIFPVIDDMPLITDFFKIDCRSKDGSIYSNIHSGIAYESSLHMRHAWQPLPRHALGYNVLMFGFDSVSRMSWLRLLPRSYAYMIKELGFVVLKGYNIVGDGTPQALLPMLTGHTEPELPEARRGFDNATFVDKFPWIWSDFKKAGYVTQWAEDMQSIGTFQLRMLGFKHQPTDHYMRVFYLEAERYYARFRRLCLGSISRHANMMNWARDMFATYGDDKPKFSFIFHSEASHDMNNPLGMLDADLLAFLVHLRESGALRNTLVMLMSDHGARFSDVRRYDQGKLEERMPFFSIRMPDHFQRAHPEHMRELRRNARKLTTPFDIHATLKSLLNFEPRKQAQGTHRRDRSQPLPRGISLLERIPRDRTCQEAHIEAHWCSCLNWIEVNVNVSSPSQNKTEKASTSSQRPLDMAQAAVEFINQLLREARVLQAQLCEPVRLLAVHRMAKLAINKKLLAFRKSVDIHGREFLFDDDDDDEQNQKNANNETSSDEHHALTFQMVLSTLPGNATYELSFRLNRTSGAYTFNKNEISRINSYGNTSQCIGDKRPDLRQFCFCRS